VSISPVRSLERMSDRTPPERNRVVDAVRAGSIGVVVVWHWSLSITYRDDTGALVNPNPLEHVPGAWAATWLLQVMPAFFMVGGYANCAAWTSARRRGDGTFDFLRRRFHRLLVPVVVFLAVWAVIEAARRWGLGAQRPVIDRYAIVFDPLWFVGAYLIVVLFVPLTATAHRRHPAVTLGLLCVSVAAVDAVGFATGVTAIRWLNLVLVWMLVHQLGYLWADGTLRRLSSRQTAGLAGLGLLGLIGLTALDVYPRSLVATTETDISHLNPPTVVIAVAALFQLGTILLFAPRLARVLQRRRPWMAVIAANAVILTIFLWHMTALLLSIFVFEGLGGTLGDDPTVSWWLTRPLWIIGPAVVLAPLVAVFAPFEVGRRSPDG
jgi:surface polysaccharide O-acyltransferase-like enzyme